NPSTEVEVNRSKQGEQRHEHERIRLGIESSRSEQLQSSLSPFLLWPPVRTVSNLRSSRVRPDRFLSLVALVVLALGWPAARADWPEFRGPWGDGHVSAPGDTKPVGFPLHWSESNNIKWKTEIPYRGWSTPVVMGGQVWLTTATEDGHDFYAIG